MAEGATGAVGAADHGTHGTSPAEQRTDRRQLSLPGLAISDGGLRLEAEPVVVAPDVEVPFHFRIVRDRDGPVTTFDELHERRMHLIVVRRDLTGFQHLHPEMDEDGTWRTTLSLPSGGVWRAFADFATEGAPTTLGVDMLVKGPVRTRTAAGADPNRHGGRPRRLA